MEKSSQVEDRINRIIAQKGVDELIIVDPQEKIISHRLNPNLAAIIEKEKKQTEIYKKVKEILDVAKYARITIRELDPLNDLTFLRIRSKNHEIMVSADNNYFLIVAQNPNEKDPE